MRYFIAVFTFVLFSKLTLGQIQNAKTEILIIGTIHSGNKYLNDKTLLKVFKKYDPDVILWEQSDKFKPVFGLLTATKLKILKPGIEQLSLQKYSKIKRNVEILPFDTLIVSREKYIKEKIKSHDAFFEKLYNAKKSYTDSLDYANYANKGNNYYGAFSSLSLTEINKPNFFETAGELFQLEKEYIIPLARKYIADTSLVKEFENEMGFWVARNNYMVDQILKYSKQFEGKRIIVLTGLNHKYYLNDKLKKQEDVNKVLIGLEAD
jgi:hypothetical protein